MTVYGRWWDLFLLLTSHWQTAISSPPFKRNTWHGCDTTSLSKRGMAHGAHCVTHDDVIKPHIVPSSPFQNQTQNKTSTSERVNARPAIVLPMLFRAE